MKTKEYYISALLVVAFIMPTLSVVYGRFEPKQPPITDPYHPEPYMLELAEQLPPEQAEILLRGIDVPSIARRAKEKRAPILIPRWPPMPTEDRPATVIQRWPPMREEDRVATVVPRRTRTPKQYRAPTVPRVSKTPGRVYTPPSRKAGPKSTDRPITYRRPDSKKIIQVHCSDIPEDELVGALERAGFSLVRLRNDPRIYAARFAQSPSEASCDTPVVVDCAGRKYLLFCPSDMAASELIKALRRHPSNFVIVEECDSSHLMSSRTSALNVVADKLTRLLNFLGSGLSRNPENR